MSASEVEIAATPYASPGGIGAYPPSWLNRLLRWIDRLPGPTWWFYLAFAVVTAILGQVIFWRAGIQPVGQIDPAQVFWGSTCPPSCGSSAISMASPARRSPPFALRSR